MRHVTNVLYAARAGHAPDEEDLQLVPAPVRAVVVAEAAELVAARAAGVRGDLQTATGRVQTALEAAGISATGNVVAPASADPHADVTDPRELARLVTGGGGARAQEPS
jgi:hypothetical protein